MDDMISRRAVLDKFEPWLKVKDYNDGELNMLKAILYEIRFMPSAQLGTNLAEVGTDCISRQAAIEILHEALDAADQIAAVPFGVYQNYRDKMNELPSAQPYTINPDGRLWITVDDIDKVTAVVVDEHKSKFCKQFYEDYEDAQPDIIRCKDCKYWHSGSCEYPEHAVNCQDYWVGDIDTEAEHFCGYAERKEDG